MMYDYEARQLKHYNPEDVCIVSGPEDNIPPNVIFESNGKRWFSITGSIGYKLELCPGVTVPAGLVQDPEYPLPSNMIVAIPEEKAEFG